MTQSLSRLQHHQRGQYITRRSTDAKPALLHAQEISAAIDQANDSDALHEVLDRMNEAASDYGDCWRIYYGPIMERKWRERYALI